jgi:hypothetical protein
MPYLNGNMHTIFTDTIGGHIKIQSNIEFGLVEQLGPQFVRTYNNYDHTTDNYNNNIVPLNTRYLSLRIGRQVMFKKIISAGLTYGADLSYRPHDVRAFVPIMLHVAKYVPVAKRLGFMFTQRVGYAFFVRNKTVNPFMQYPGVEGGLNLETVVGLCVVTRHKNMFTVNTGYRLQHVHSKTIFIPGQGTQGAGLPALPSSITEISNGFYDFIYFTMGVTF